MLRRDYLITDEGADIDQTLIEKAAVLTGIGIGTAFGVLVLLMIVIMAIRLCSAWLNRDRSLQQGLGDANGASEDRDRALAAIIAVTAVIGDGARGERVRVNGDDS